MTTPAIHRIHDRQPPPAEPGPAPGPAPQAFVFRFDQLPEVKRTAKTWDEVKALLGGKGANLAEMTRLGLPVPARLHRDHRGVPRIPEIGQLAEGALGGGGRRAA